MKAQCLSSDIISALPQDVLDKILTLMPIRDALRTSILSRKWRYSWRSMPKLAFDDELFEVTSHSNQLQKYKFVNAIFHVLLLHKGPILEFNLNVGEHEMVSEFHQIKHYLSRTNDVKIFIFSNSMDQCKIPSLFFSWQGLEDLDLRFCDFEPPLTFNGFSRLRSLCFQNVKITTKMLQQFLSNCPLEHVTLIGYQREFVGGNKFTFIELVQCLPSNYTLEISKYYMKYFAAGGMPQYLPISLVHLEYLFLDVCLMEEDVLSSALCMIRSSPNLKIIIFTMYDNEKLPVRKTSINFLDLYDDLGLDLKYLEEFGMQEFSNLTFEMEFVKLIMAKSPSLKKARIELDADVSIDEELKMFRDLIRRPFPRASPSVKFIIERPKLSHEDCYFDDAS